MADKRAELMQKLNIIENDLNSEVDVTKEEGRNKLNMLKEQHKNNPELLDIIAIFVVHIQHKKALLETSSSKILGAMHVVAPTPPLDSAINDELAALKSDVKKIIKLIENNEATIINGGVIFSEADKKSLKFILRKVDEARNIPQLEKAFELFWKSHDKDSQIIKILSNHLSKLPEKKAEHQQLDSFLKNLLSSINSMKNKIADTKSAKESANMELMEIKASMTGIVVVIAKSIPLLQKTNYTIGQSDLDSLDKVLGGINSAAGVEELAAPLKVLDNYVKAISKHIPPETPDHINLKSLNAGDKEKLMDIISNINIAMDSTNTDMNEYRQNLAPFTSDIHFSDSEIYYSEETKDKTVPFVEKTIDSSNEDIEQHPVDSIDPLSEPAQTDVAAQLSDSNINYNHETAEKIATLVKPIIDKLKNSYIDKLNDFILDKMQSNLHDTVKNDKTYQIALELRDTLTPEISTLIKINSRAEKSSDGVEKAIAAVKKIDEALDTASKALKNLDSGEKDVTTRSWEGRVKQFVMGGKVSLSEVLIKHEKNPGEFSADRLKEAMKSDRGLGK